MNQHQAKKRCSRCRKEYPRTTEFWGTVTRNKDGFNCYCRPCRRVKLRESYVKNKADRHRRNLLPEAKFQGYRNGARQRGVRWDLTREQFEMFWQKPCAYCGQPIATIGLDRIDHRVNPLRALGVRRDTPGGEGPARSGDGTVELLARAFRRLREHLPVGGVDDAEGFGSADGGSVDCHRVVGHLDCLVPSAQIPKRCFMRSQ